MALPIQRDLLRSFVQSMHDEGIVNDDFYQLLAMKDTVSQDYVVRAVTSYCLSAQNLFSHLTYHISQPNVDYHQANTAAREFYARTCSIGAEHVKISCAELIQACQENNKEYCSRALYWTKNEYSRLRRKFETLVQEWKEVLTIPFQQQYDHSVPVNVAVAVCTSMVEDYRFSVNIDCFVCPNTKGILSDPHIQTLKVAEEPDYAEQLINTYCTDVEAILLQLTGCIDLHDVDFSQLAVLAQQIEEKSSCFGAEHVRLACADLIQACDQMHKRDFNRALIWLQNEFAHTRNKLESVIQMERRIMRLLLKQEERQRQQQKQQP